MNDDNISAIIHGAVKVLGQTISTLPRLAGFGRKRTQMEALIEQLEGEAKRLRSISVIAQRHHNTIRHHRDCREVAITMDKAKEHFQRTLDKAIGATVDRTAPPEQMAQLQVELTNQIGTCLQMISSLDSKVSAIMGLKTSVAFIAHHAHIEQRSIEAWLNDFVVARRNLVTKLSKLRTELAKSSNITKLLDPDLVEIFREPLEPIGALQSVLLESLYNEYIHYDRQGA